MPGDGEMFGVAQCAGDSDWTGYMCVYWGWMRMGCDGVDGGGKGVIRPNNPHCTSLSYYGGPSVNKSDSRRKVVRQATGGDVRQERGKPFVRPDGMS